MHIRKHQTVIAAHRGGAALWAENSMTAFRGALSLAVEQIETDIHLSADGEPFILHDPTLDRTTYGTGTAAARTWIELSRVRLRATAGDAIPHLDDLLGLLAPTPMALRLELKRNAAGEADLRLFQRAVASLDRFRMTPRTTFTSFEQRYLTEVIASGLGAGHLWLVGRDVQDRVGLDGVLDAARSTGIAEIAVHVGRADHAAAERIRSRGVRFGCYAVNDRAAIEKALALGAVAFTTDRPDLAVDARRRLE